MYRDILKHYWNIEADLVEPLERTTASCFRVFSGEAVYFLKEFQASFSAERAIVDAKICGILNANDIPASEIITTVLGQAYATFQGRIYQLQKYAFGKTPSQNSLGESAMCRAASYLGKIHRALKNENLPLLFDDSWFGKFDEFKYISFYSETLALLAEKETPTSTKKKIEEDIAFAVSLTKEMHSWVPCFTGVTYCASHGDYTPSQLRCDGDNIVRIIDLANVHTVPVSWELMRFYYLASSDCSFPQDFDWCRFRSYLRSYANECPLSGKDMENMIYIFLYYMGRNRFLYRDFLKTGSEVSFADSSRRVMFCRYFYENADALSAKLRTL